ncbi:MAG: hypothetical protein ACOYO0_02490, partial [Sandarakinorhabdus sp.]
LEKRTLLKNGANSGVHVNASRSVLNSGGRVKSRGLSEAFQHVAIGGLHVLAVKSASFAFAKCPRVSQHFAS